ncbi:anti-sigma regulatory factor [Carboxylicivirga sp. A043]|uniref:ATP-binding protein n=1 Tax=Carboxylicivirga litoralis TaxID=2816963 RepID=UPI0021CAE576|nr:anti-sigma regulatory factor [Carboxylicivirga sp. A043]MCU4154425.1 anti-sigma regulatory factor [Carboxylicivirga sp. A043]
MEFNYEVEGGNFTKAGNAASNVKKVLKQLNVDPKIIKRIVVALYEGEVNVVAHAYKGNVLVDIDTDRIYIKIQDEGPGIPDIDLAMQVGYSTASAMVREMGFGAGMGLPNMKRNADTIDITSKVGEGTIVELTTKLTS